MTTVGVKGLKSVHVTYCYGATENARPDIAGVDNAAPCSKGGHRGTSARRRRLYMAASRLANDMCCPANSKGGHRGSGQRLCLYGLCVTFGTP